MTNYRFIIAEFVLNRKVPDILLRIEILHLNEL